MARVLVILSLAAALAACGRDQRSAAVPAADTPPNPSEPASAPVSSLAAYVPPASGAQAR